MNETGCFANRLREVRCKRNDVVVCRLFDLVYAIDRETRVRLDLFKSVVRNDAILCVNLAYGDFDIQPFLELVLFGPKRPHFGEGVAINHEGSYVRQAVSLSSMFLYNSPHNTSDRLTACRTPFILARSNSPD